MKHLVIPAALVAALSSAALAQTAPAPASSAARDTTGSTARAPVNAAPLENGANSFTQEQAGQRLRDAGISDLTDLVKDDNGIWRGRGQWQGRDVSVGLDFRGNISAQ